MNLGRTVFAQLVDLLPRKDFDLAVRRYDGQHRVRALSCMDQMLCMLFSLLTSRSGLRDTVHCQRALSTRRNNLAEQAIRFVVIDQLITQGMRSERGRQWNERIWTAIATSTQQGRSVLACLRQSLVALVDRIPAPSLLPMGA